LLAAAPAWAAGYEDVYTIGFINRGPAFAFEETMRVLGGANYRVLSVQDGKPAEIMAQHRLDALWVIDGAAVEQKKEEMFGTKRWWTLRLDGRLYTSDGSKPWTATVQLDAKDQATVERQAIVKLLNDLVIRVGYKPRDLTGPEIALEYPHEGQSMRTSAAVVLGKVSDAAKVLSIKINGQDVPFTPQRAANLYYPVRFAEGALRDPLAIEVLAADVHGNESTKRLVVYRGKPITARVASAYGNEGTLNRGSVHGIRKGMAFTLYNVQHVQDPSNGKWRWDRIEVGPAVVVAVTNTRSTARLLGPGSFFKGDMVR
jgi:hypothetical protein